VQSLVGSASQNGRLPSSREWNTRKYTYIVTSSKIQLLDKIHSPLLDASICKAIMECGRCKNFGPMHVHALLAPMTRRRPFEALASDYLSMPTGKGGFGKIGLYIDVFARKLWGFKSKTAAGKNTVDNLRRITQAFTAPEVLIVDGGSHFDCNEVREYCDSIGTKLHVVAAYSPWLKRTVGRV